ncbi:diadenosine tetraphosphatase [Wigglesworthia glossinidia endosymbiont of Glossina morsitans morsitans (Yale colony)]|uniref:bis(5'-nucleosyl)-tetraphosphatase (symmetrical) n=1 Tax=Wigglesworthia glossinidia endosymbiont of Glossina morsitans morsitans (Yale colony) TaxID=1142511 RepID=H6Q4A1_WIGGL|nr:symmetrical bis(5'-nucleosyl)-tetraphosphatase [Wigglesworthia glossinidia]AFA40884.1 diadenosine tetraphosphatase [Wigglesworthia glossinidia endosymbiont of Glossina morsitans morsitans (Yale colony)]
MSRYIIGDIHGCYKAFLSLLKLIKFNFEKDTLWITGDFVGRGPNSLDVLRFIYKFRKNIFVILGNHEISLLLAYINKKKFKIDPQFMQIIHAPDSSTLIRWLRNQPILKIDEKNKLIMVHAGILPNWNLNDLLKNAKDIENNLKKKQYKIFLNKTCKKNNISNKIWHDNLTEEFRLQLSINIFTRIRYCFSKSIIDMHHKISPKKAPNFIKPWFNFYNTVLNEYNIVFGHWSSLGNYPTPKNIYKLDTGCCWGGELTALKWANKKFFSVKCQ